MIRLFRKTYSDEHPWIAKELLTEEEHAWMYTPGVGMPPYEGSTRNFTLMEDDSIQVRFSLVAPVSIGVGDFFVDDNFGLFEITEAAKPDYNSDNASYVYNIKAEAQYRTWKNRMVCLCYPLADGTYYRGNSLFSLTDTIANHAQIVLNNAHASGLRYISGISDDGVPMLEDYTLSIDIEDGTEREMRHVAYEQTSGVDALTTIAETWECEWWFEGRVLHFGRCENDTEEANRPQWVLGDTMETMEQDGAEEKFANRLKVLGGTQNIPETYRKTATFTITRVWSRTGLEGSEESNTRYFFYALNKPVRPEYFRSAERNRYVAGNVYSSAKESGGILPLLTFMPKNCGYYNIRLTNIRVRVLRTINAEEDTEATGTVELLHKDMAMSSPVYTSVGGAVGLSALSQLDGREIICSYGNSIYNNYIAIRVTLDDMTDLYGITVNCDTVAVESPMFARNIRTTDGEIIACNSLRMLPDSDEYRAICVYEGNVQDDWVVGKSFTLDNKYIAHETMPGGYFDEAAKGNGVSDYVDYAQSEVRLRLPVSHGSDYVDAVTGLQPWEVVEDAITIDNIYPKQKDWRIGTPVVVENDPAGAITTEHSTGETTTKYIPVYYVRHSAFDGLEDGDGIPSDNPYVFLEDYLLRGEELRIKFEVGAKLGGMSFSAVFNPYKRPIKNNDGTYNAGAQWFKLLPNEEYGRRLPDEVGRPETDDPFILTGFDAEAITGIGLVSEAEQELLSKAREEVSKRYRCEGTSSCHLMSDYAASVGGGEYLTADGFTIITADGFKLCPKGMGMGNLIPFREGMQVRIFNSAVFPKDGRVSRIIGYELKLDYPWDTPTFVVGESKPYSKIKALAKELKV